MGFWKQEFNEWSEKLDNGSDQTSKLDEWEADAKGKEACLRKTPHKSDAEKGHRRPIRFTWDVEGDLVFNILEGTLCMVLLPKRLEFGSRPVVHAGGGFVRREVYLSPIAKLVDRQLPGTEHLVRAVRRFGRDPVQANVGPVRAVLPSSHPLAFGDTDVTHPNGENTKVVHGPVQSLLHSIDLESLILGHHGAASFTLRQHGRPEAILFVQFDRPLVHLRAGNSQRKELVGWGVIRGKRKRKGVRFQRSGTTTTSLKNLPPTLLFSRVVTRM